MKKTILVLIMAFLCNTVFAQTVVTGKVVASEDGSPVEFVNVHVKGTLNGTTTDASGSYSLSNVASNGVLVFTFVGYKTLEIPVNGRAVINAQIELDALGLDEIIVVAYGTTKRSSYTGAASVVKTDAIKDIPVASFESSLSGRVAGLQMSPGSGQAGSTGSIRIRGVGSMNASKDPLYVIDGVPVVSGDVSQLSYVSSNVMSSLNPADIESITVLKDAAASSLYGSRAANGVIMIQTKRGQNGAPRIDFRASIGFAPSFATKNFEIASPEEQMELALENRYNEAIDGGKTPAEAEAYAQNTWNNRMNKYQYDGRGYYDWEDALLRTAVYQSYDLSVSGANDKTNYYTSFSYTKDQGRSYLNEFDRISGRVNLSQKIGKHVEIGANVNISNSNKSGWGDDRNANRNYFYMARNLLWEQYWPTYADGSWYTPRYGSLSYNPLYFDDKWEQTSNTLKVSAVETLSIYLLPELTFKSIFSYDNTTVREHNWWSPDHYMYQSTDGQVNEYSTIIKKVVTSNTLTYQDTFADRHNLNVLVGFEAEDNVTDYMRSSGKFLPNSSLKTVSVCGELDASSYNWGYSMVSILSRLEYNFDSKYMLSASLRRDASSRFGVNSRWGTFWSVGGVWNIKNEAFMSSADILSTLRLRASYGVNGTTPGTNYGHISLYSYSSKYMSNPGGAISTVSDPDLSWESNYTTNIALEAGLFENRLNLVLELFNRDSKDLLQNVAISRVTGFSNILTNFGEMNNKGIEIDLNGDIIRTRDLTWNVGLTASFIRSKVTKLYDGADIFWYDPTGDDSRAKFVYREGVSPNTFIGTEYAGPDPQTGDPRWFVNRSEPIEESRWEGSVDGREITYTRSRANEVEIGTSDPKVYGGVNTSLSWKGLTVGINFTYKIGGQTYDFTEKDNGDDGYYSERIMSKQYYDNRWTPENPNAYLPRRTYDATSAQGYQSRKLHPADYLRLKDISVSYSLPKSFTNKLRISDARVFFSGANLFTIAAWKDYDPEVNVYGTRGWEMPASKTFTFGVQFGF